MDRSHDGYKNDVDGLSIPDSPVSPYVDQRKVFTEIGQDILDCALSGYSCSIFAYGQTGSGKSYTIMGYQANRGIVPMVCEELFKTIANQSNAEKTFQVKISMLEIYNEKIHDLLATSGSLSATLQVRQSPDGGFYVPGLTQLPVNSFEDIEQRIDQGSERVATSGSSGDRLKEGASINLSLSALGNVISALAERKKQIPYRDSVLTKLLKNALGGNSQVICLTSLLDPPSRVFNTHPTLQLSKTIMIASISPADINYSETLSTLRYADRAKQIQNKAVVNEDPIEKLIRELKTENQRLKELISTSLESTATELSATKSELDQRHMDEAKSAKIRELIEQLKANDAELEAQDLQAVDRKIQSVEDHIKPVPRSGDKLAATDSQTPSKPYLTNLNEDPQLTGVIRHVLQHKTTGVGRIQQPIDGSESSGTGAKAWIVLPGLGVSDRHALFIRHKKDGSEIELRLLQDAGQQMTKVNGRPLVESSIRLVDCDRVLFGSHQLYVFHNPLAPAKDKELLAKIDWDFAQQELVSSSEFEALNRMPRTKEEKIIRGQLMELIPMLFEVNTMASEMGKQRFFDLVLIPPTAQSLTYREARMTKIAVRMKDTSNDQTWLWDKEKFMNRRFIMQDQYEKFMSEKSSTSCIDTSKSSNTDRSNGSQQEHASDPYWDPSEDKFVGVANAFLQTLGYRLELDEKLKVTAIDGQIAGQLSVSITPVDNDEREGGTTVGFVDNPEKLLGQRVTYQLSIHDLELYNPTDKTKVTIEYRVFNEPSTTIVKLPDLYFAASCNVVTGTIDHDRRLDFSPISKEHLAYFRDESIGFLVYASQDSKSTGNVNGNSMMTKLSNSVENGRRASKLITNDLQTSNQLKLNLNLAENQLEQYRRREEQFKELVNKLSQTHHETDDDEFSKLVQDLQSHLQET